MALALLVSSGAAQSHELEYWDCGKPQNRHEISLITACDSENKIIPEKKVFTLIQPRTHEIYRGFVCSVRRSTFRWHCGMFSHTMPVSVPTIDVPEDVGLTQCYTMAKRGQYVDHTGRTRLIDMDEEVVFTVNEAGAIVDNHGTVSCQGDDIRVGGETMSKVIQLSQYKIEVHKEEYIHSSDGSLEAVYAKMKLPPECDVDGKMCYASGRTFIFNSKKSCRYHKIQQIEVSLENGYLVDHRNKLIFKKGERRSFQDDCSNNGFFYVTEYSNLYLTNSTDEFKAVTEIDLSLYVNARSDYIVYQSEMRLLNMTNRMNIDLCTDNMKDRTEDKIFQLKNEEFGLVRGDVLSLFQCEKKVGVIAETGSCYNRIPLLSGEFVHPRTKMVTNVATEVSCQRRFPLVVRTRGGLWCNIGPGVSARNPPEELSTLEHHSYHHEDMARGGLYSQSELSQWQEHVTWGDYRQGTIEKIAGGLCKGDRRCRGPAADHHPALTLNSLVESVKNYDPYAAAKDFIHTWGGLAALIVLAKMIGDLMVSFVLISLTYTSHGFHAARTLVSTLFCNPLYNHAKMKRKLARARQFDLMEETHHREDSPGLHLTRYHSESQSRRGDSQVNIEENVTGQTSVSPSEVGADQALFHP